MKLIYSSRRLRIAIVTETYPPEVNGVARAISTVVGELSRRTHSVQLVRPRQHTHDHGDVEPGINTVLVRGVPMPRYAGLRMGAPATRLLGRMWSARRPDIVQVVTEGPLGASAVRAARRLGIPVVSEFHTNFHLYGRHYGAGWLGTLIAAHLRRLHARADCTLVPTAQLKEELGEQGYARLRVVGRGIDTTRFNPGFRCAALRREWGVEAHEPVALYVGRIAPEKNLPLFVDTMDTIRAHCPRLHVVVVGDGPALGALRASRPDYHYAGMRGGTDLARHYASADLFAFPSLTETYGNVTTEAMASGLGIVAFDYGAARLHLQHRHNGLLAQYGDAAQFIALAQELTRDTDLRTRLRAATIETARALDWGVIVDELEAVFHQIIRQTKSRAAPAPPFPVTRIDHGSY